MIRLYALREGVLRELKLAPLADETPAAGWDDVVWVDLLDPSREEKDWAERTFSVDVPTPGEMHELEASSRCYQEADSVHLVTSFVVASEAGSHTVDVWFNLHQGRLFTVRPEKVLPFRLFRMRSQQTPGEVREAIDIPLGVFEAAVDYLADTLEASYARLEKVSRLVLAEKDRDLEAVLATLAAEEDVQAKVRVVLLDLRRSLTFLIRWIVAATPRATVIKGILRDLDSLSSHSAFLFEKIEFLMDAALGFINLEQNKIIKIFSIAAVVFLPPTLVASIYGMNFEVMPELKHPFGYAFALVLMAISGAAPYVFFKRKGWL